MVAMSSKGYSNYLLWPLGIKCNPIHSTIQKCHIFQVLTGSLTFMKDISELFSSVFCEAWTHNIRGNNNSNMLEGKNINIHLIWKFWLILLIFNVFEKILHILLRRALNINGFLKVGSSNNIQITIIYPCTLHKCFSTNAHTECSTSNQSTSLLNDKFDHWLLHFFLDVFNKTHVLTRIWFHSLKSMHGCPKKIYRNKPKSLLVFAAGAEKENLCLQRKFSILVSGHICDNNID